MARTLCPSGNGLKFGKGCRLIAMTTALISLYSLAFIYPMVNLNLNLNLNLNNNNNNNKNSPPFKQKEQKQRPVGWLARHKDHSRRPLAENELIDLKDFAYVLEPLRPCWSGGDGDYKRTQGSQLYFIVYVHSAPKHFQARQSIRSTWGSLRDSDFGMRLVFMLGLNGGEDAAAADDDDDERQQKLQRKIIEEHLLYDDIVQGNFADTYRNLTYKHLMGYKWATSRCPLATLIVKADDDAFVDLIQLHRVLDELYAGNKPIRDALACSVWPAGSSPQRRHGAKWAVTYNDYPYDSYPSYCGGLGYVVSPDVARDLLVVATSRTVPFFWIDDVYVTGLLVEALSAGLQRQALNLRTTYETSALVQWLRSNTHGANRMPCPYVFGDVSGSGDNRARVMHRLWQKTIDFWRKEGRLSSRPSLPTTTSWSPSPSSNG